MKSKNAILSLLLLFTLTGCTDKTAIPEDFDYGTVKENSYSNNFFGFTMDIPSKWVVQSDEENKKMMEAGAKIISGKDENLHEAILKASEIKTATLLTIFKDSVGTTTEYNPSAVLVAENIKAFPATKTGKDYLTGAKETMAKLNVEYKELKINREKEILNGQEFYSMDVILLVNSLDVHQKYYATVKNDFALLLIFSYATNEQKSELDAVKKSINFLKSL